MSKTKIKAHKGMIRPKDSFLVTNDQYYKSFAFYKRKYYGDEIKITILEIRGKHLTKQELEQIKKVIQ